MMRREKKLKDSPLTNPKRHFDKKDKPLCKGWNQKALIFYSKEGKKKRRIKKTIIIVYKSKAF